MSVLLDNALVSASTELDRVRNDLEFVRSAVVHRASIDRDRNASIVSGCYVWTAAAIEKFIKSTIEGLLTEINNSGVTYNRLKSCLFSLACAPDFYSLQDIRGLRMWRRRVDIFGKLDLTSNVAFNLAELPLDGATIRPDHLEAIWFVFDIGGSSIPSPRHRFALIDVAEGRNQVAHGEIDPITFGRNKVPTDVLNIVNYIEEIVLHINMATIDYLRNVGYER